jgi:transposase
MAAPKLVLVNETISELKALLKSTKPIFVPRLRMLIEIKKHETAGISKRDLADLVGVNHNSIQSWRSIYSNGGIKALISHRKTGYKKSIFTKEEHLAIKEKLHNPENGIRGYKELLQWVEKELGKDCKYNTLLKYCTKNFGSSIKVARKSHVKKDEEAVNSFKKTSKITVKT